MVQAYVICTCTTCGKEFSNTRTFKNRSQADSYEKWAKKTINTCSDCFIKKEAEKNLPNFEKWANDIMN